MGMKEILEAKRLAALVEEAPKQEITSTVGEPTFKEAVKPLEEKVLPEKVEIISALVDAPNAVKPLTFAEKMAQKKAAEAGASVSATVPTATAAPVATPAPQAPSAVLEIDSVKQAYVDIKGKIDQLEATSEENLKDAMSTLKAALMANPAAVSLMEDTDMGKMVIALRRYTKEEVIAASVNKKVGRKPKETIDLTDPTVMQAVIDEL